MADNISLIHRSIKVTLDLTDEQKSQINQGLGNTRFYWNYCLIHKENFYNSIKHLSKKEQKEAWKTYERPTYKEVMEIYPFLNISTPKESYQQKQRDLEQAYTNFLNSINLNVNKPNKKEEGFNKPKIKEKNKGKDSLRCCMISPKCFDWYHRTITVPIYGTLRFRHAEDKKGKWISWFLDAAPKNITISKDSVGDYYCSITFEKEAYIPRINISGTESQGEGLDYSPSKLYVSSKNKTGKDFGYKPFKQSNKRVKRLQKSLARKKGYRKGEEKSKNFEKARVKLAKEERKIANQRRDFHEKESLRLVRENEFICIENLNLKSIAKFLPNAKNIEDTGWGNFTKMLERKSIFNNCVIIKADKWYPSSKTCYLCGHINHNLKLSDRTYICPECGFTIDRDLNAALNLQHYAYCMINKLPLEQGKVKSVESVEGEIDTIPCLSGAFVEAEMSRSDSIQRSHLL